MRHNLTAKDNLAGLKEELAFLKQELAGLTESAQPASAFQIAYAA